MTAGVAHDRNWIGFTLIGVSLVFGIAVYLLGVVMLIFVAVPLLLYLVYRWLHDAVWHSYAWADVLEWAGVSGSMSDAGITTWFLETSLLVVVSAVGGSLTLGGLAILIGIGFMIVLREERAAVRGDAKRRSTWKSSRSALNPDW